MLDLARLGAERILSTADPHFGQSITGLSLIFLNNSNPMEQKSQLSPPVDLYSYMGIDFVGLFPQAWALVSGWKRYQKQILDF